MTERRRARECHTSLNSPFSWRMQSLFNRNSRVEIRHRLLNTPPAPNTLIVLSKIWKAVIRARTMRWCPELVDFPERCDCKTPKINRGNTVPTVVNVCRTQAKQACLYAASAGSEVVVPLLSFSVNLAEKPKPFAGRRRVVFSTSLRIKKCPHDRSVQSLKCSDTATSHIVGP